MIEISAFIAQEHLSLAQVASSVTCFLPEVSVNRMLVEGPSPSTHIRSRFPLHPSLSAVDGAFIEGKGEWLHDTSSLAVFETRLRWLTNRASA